MIKVKEKSERPGLKFNIEQKKMMASDPITSWKIDEETMERVIDFTFLGSQITADGDCSHEIKKHLLPRIKAMTNLDSILKSRDITLLMKFHISSVQSLSRVQLFVTSSTAACQASLSITNSRSLLKLMPFESVVTSNHLIICRPLLLLPSIFPSIRVFSNESVL